MGGYFILGWGSRFSFYFLVSCFNFIRENVNIPSHTFNIGRNIVQVNFFDKLMIKRNEKFGIMGDKNERFG